MKTQFSSLRLLILSAGLGFLFFFYASCSHNATEEKIQKLPQPVKKPEFVKGIHLTSWVAGSKKGRERIETFLRETEINTIVIAIKEYQGEVYIPGVPLAIQHKLFVNAIPDIKEYIAQLKEKGIYTVARIVVFKDNGLPRKKRELATQKADGSLWEDYRKVAWTDPYNKEVWEYNLSVATQAVALGFQEIQFDYVRFPSDGDTKQCRYSYSNHNASSAVKNLYSFLEFVSQRLKPLGVHVSIDVFGLTTSVQHDMGIGQKIIQMTEVVDYVSPMVYPSHYAKGEYGISEPNREPYKVVHKSMISAKERLGKDYAKLRPYLQDFSLGYKYGPKEVRAQIQACEDAGINEWLLWNPNCNYTRAALKSKDGTLQAAAQISKPPTAKSELSTTPAPLRGQVPSETETESSSSNFKTHSSSVSIREKIEEKKE